MTSNEQEYAQLSQAAYDKKRKNYDFAKYLAEDSTPETAVYKHKNGKVIVASRGTTLGQGIGTAVKDLSTDFLVGLGLSHLSNRNTDLTKHIDKLSKKYGKKALELTGHSLGGTLANNVAKAKGLASKVFNRGSSPAEMLQKQLLKPHRKKHPKKNLHYSVEGDIVSGFDKKKSLKRKQKMDGAHGIGNFTKAMKKK